jgi:hypothetical protein
MVAPIAHMTQRDLVCFLSGCRLCLHAPARTMTFILTALALPCQERKRRLPNFVSRNPTCPIGEFDGFAYLRVVQTCLKRLGDVVLDTRDAVARYRGTEGGEFSFSGAQAV